MKDIPAIEGGEPVRKELLPYGRQSVSECDIQAVVDVLRSPWLTTGPKVAEFEKAFAQHVGAAEAVAVSSGTAALHAITAGLGIGPGDEVIVPAITFAASANCVLFQGGTPVFADVDPKTLLIDPAEVKRLITPRTRAIMAVDYAGQPCDYDALKELANSRKLTLVADACHSLGARWRDRPVGSLARASAFSLHPVKHITSGEGGVITTDDPDLAQRMRSFRNHGMTTDARQREQIGSWVYDVVELGYNYRLTDFQCALALSQLPTLPDRIRRRQTIARVYDKAFAEQPGIQPLEVHPNAYHAYHLYTIQLELDRLRVDRSMIFRALRAEGIGVNVHYIPVHLHPYYKKRLGTGPGLCPKAEAAYERLVTLPLFPDMTEADTQNVIAAVARVLNYYAR